MIEDGGALKSPSVLKFPRIFMFYSRILHTPSTFAFVAHCLSVLAFLQQVAISLLPVLIRVRREELEVTWVHRTLCLILYGRQEFPWQTVEDSYASKLLAFLAVFIITCSIAYAQHIWGFETPSFLRQTRCLLVFFAPNYVVLAMTIHSAKFVNKLLIDGYSTSVVLQLLTEIAVSGIAQSLTTTFWPLLHGNPMLGEAQVPTRLMPSMSVDHFLQVQMWLVGTATFIPNRMTILFVTASFVILGIFKWYDMWSLPYMSMYYTVMNAMVGVSFVMAPLLFWLSARLPFLTDAKLLLLTGIVNVIGIIVASLKYSRLEARVLEELMNQEHIELSSTKEAIMYAQFAVLNNCITPALLDALKAVSKSEKDIHVTMSRLYCEILISGESYSAELQTIARNLFSVDSLSPMDKFTAYQIYQTVVHDKLICDDPEATNSISERVAEYRAQSDEFWTSALLGNIERSLSLLHELSYKLTGLISDFDILLSFYPKDPHVMMLEYDFFKHFRSSSGAQDFAGGPTLKKGHLRYIGSTHFNKVEKLLLLTDESDTVSRTSSDDQDKNLGKMTENLQSYFTPHVSTVLLVLFGITAAWMVTVAFLTIFPIQKYVDSVSKFENLQSLVSGLLDMSDVSSKLWFLAGQLVNDTSVVDPGIVSVSESGAVNMEIFQEKAHILHQSIAKFANDFVTLERFNEFYPFASFWKSERVIMTMSVGGEMRDEEAGTSLPSYLLYFSALVSDMIQASPEKNLTTGHRFVKFIHCRAKAWMENWDLVHETLAGSFDILRVFCHDLQDRIQRDYYYSGYRYAVFVLIFAGVISILTALKINHEQQSIVLKYFRPQKHPNPEIDVVRSEHVQTKPLNQKSQSYLFLLICFIFVFFAGEAVIKMRVDSITGVILSDLDSVISMAKLTIASERLFDSVLRAWQFQSPEKLEAALRLCDLFSEEQNNVVKSIVLFKSADIPSEFFERHSTYNRNSSDTDVYNGYTVIELGTVFVMAVRDLLQSGTPVGDERHCHLTKLYRTVLAPKARKTGQIFMNQVTEQIATLVSVSQIEEFLVMCYLFTCIGCVIWELLSLIIVARQYARFMYTIPPKTIAENDCMMSFFIEGDAKPLFWDAQNSTMNLIYNKSHAAVIMCSMTHTIVAFTPDVNAMFSYRSEQLVGQSIELLIPKDTSMGCQNDNKFYQQLEIVKNEQTDFSFERDLIGMSSDGALLQLHVNVSLMEYQGVNLFVIQLKSISDLLYYEEMLSSYSECYSCMCQGSYAFQLFPEFLSTSVPMEQLFKHSALVGIFVNRNEREDEDETVRQVSELSLVEYLSGNDSCCILANSSHHVIVLFVDKDGSSSYLENAVKFYQTYFVDGVGCRGFIIHENETKLILFPPPPIPEGYSGRELPFSAANALIPSITFEVLAPVIEAIPELLRQLQTSQFIVSNDVLAFLPNPDDIFIAKLEKTRNLELFSVSSICPTASPRI